MKKFIAVVCLLFASMHSNAQICSFTVTQIGNPNCFVFVPNVTPAAPNQTILWDFGDGASMVSAQPTYTYAQSGNYTVTMSLLDSTSALPLCTATQLVSVSFCNISYFQDSTNSSIYYFSDLTNGALSQVVWDFGDNTSSSSSSVNHLYTNPGVYTVTCTQTVNGVIFCSTSIIIQIGSSCSYQVSSPSPSSPNNVKLFTAIVPNSTGTVTWDFGDGSPLVTGLSVQKGFAAAGTYNVCMTYIAGIDTCNYCSQVTISNGSTSSNCSFTSTQTGSTTFDFISSNVNTANQFEFNFGDGVSLLTNGITSHTYTTAGNFLVCMNEIDTNGVVICSYCQPIIIQTPTSNCQAAFTYSNVGTDVYFVNQSVANPMLGTPVAYLWDFGDGTTSTSAFPHHVYSNFGAYNVCLTVTTALCTSTYCDSILVDTINNPNGSPCSAQFVFTQTSPYIISAVVLYPGSGYNYNWNFGDGSPLVNQLYTSHFYSNPGTYNVCLTMASAFIGCTNTYCDSLTVDSLGNIIYKGINTGFTLQTTTPTLLTGIDNNQNEFTISVQPNPAHSAITITGTTEFNNYELLNTVGQTVAAGSFINKQNTIDISELSNGVYIIKVTDKNGNSYKQKIIKN